MIQTSTFVDMNTLDTQYLELLQDILDNGVRKEDRTGTGTLSVFGRQIRHNMSEGFPLLTTKKMPFRLIATELMWFLRGDTNIEFLHDNDCHIWDGDYAKSGRKDGDLGPIYGKQWRSWEHNTGDTWVGMSHKSSVKTKIDQIANLIRDLKTNPDSRRLMVSAWNVGELDQMTLPPCHYGFQVYTRELSAKERTALGSKGSTRLYDSIKEGNYTIIDADTEMHKVCDEIGIPKRAISLMWNQRSVDSFLGLPFNIASYGLLLEIIAAATNMVPDELIGNLGDTHLYLNHIDQAKEQIGRELSDDERYNLLSDNEKKCFIVSTDPEFKYGEELIYILDTFYKHIPKRTREPYPLPTLNINTEWWPTESGECGVGPIDAAAVFHPDNVHFYKSLLEEDLQLANYQSHPAIKAPLSN